MRLSRLLAAAAAPVLLLGVTITPSAADDVSNNLDGSIDAIAEVMPLNAGGINGTTTLFVQPRTGSTDPVNGCNVKNTGTLTVSITSSDPSKATVSPSSVTFTDCGEANGKLVIV